MLQTHNSTTLPVGHARASGVQWLACRATHVDRDRLRRMQATCRGGGADVEPERQEKQNHSRDGQRTYGPVRDASIGSDSVCAARGGVARRSSGPARSRARARSRSCPGRLAALRGGRSSSCRRFPGSVGRVGGRGSCAAESRLGRLRVARSRAGAVRLRLRVDVLGRMRRDFSCGRFPASVPSARAPIQAARWNPSRVVRRSSGQPVMWSQTWNDHDEPGGTLPRKPSEPSRRQR